MHSITTLALVLVASDPAALFAELEAPGWVERDLAQRRLAVELKPGDGLAIRAALASGGAETRLRLAHVLGTEDRLFGTAAELALDPAPNVARAGQTGLRLAIARFEPDAYAEPLPADELWPSLAWHDGTTFDADALGPWDPAHLADLLALAQPGAPELAFQGDGATSPLARAAPRSGSWREFARAVAQRAGGRLLGFGVRRESGPSVVRWLLVSESRTPVEDLWASDVLERWCLDFARADGTRRAAAARSLASHGLPPAMEWLSRRFEEARDDAAFEGLLLAARRTRTPAVLQAPAARAHLWDELERAAEREGDRALHAAIALSRVGPPTGSNGEAEYSRAFADLDLARPRRAELALVALEGWSGPRAPAELASAIRGLLGRTDLEPRVRLQALRVAARLRLADPIPGDVLGFARAVARAGRFDELCRLLRGTPNWPPDAWAGQADLGLGDGSSLDLVDAWLARGRLEPAAEVLVRELSRSPFASARLRDFDVPEDRVRAAAERAVSSSAGQVPATWFVLCGVATEAERHERLVAFLEEEPTTEAEWCALAELCAGSTGVSARARFAALLPSTAPDLGLRAASRAVAALRAAIEDEAEQEFLRAVRGVVRADRGGPLDRAFGPEAWPPRAGIPVTRWIDFERGADRGAR